MISLSFLLLAACIFSLGIELGVIYEHFFTTDVPAAIGHTMKLRILHCIFLLVINCGKICEKLGICSMPKFVRFLMQRIPVKKDPKLMVKNLFFGRIPVRLYQPKAMSTSLRKGIIFFHGGGMIIGSLDAYNSLCCYLSRDTDSVVLSVGYRLAPEHRYPSGLNDCMAASIHFLRTLETYGVDPFRVILCGDSCGGTLVASICQTLMTQPDLPKIRAQILIYPYLQGFNFQLPSYQQNKNVLFLTQNFAISCIFQYFDIQPSWKTAILNGAHLPPEMREKSKERLNVDNIPKKFKEKGYQYMSLGPFNEDAYHENKQLLWTVNSPLIADNDIIAQLPETLLISCEFDVLRDDALLYKKRLEDQGVPVSWHHIEDGFHGVLSTFDKKYFCFPCSLKILNTIVHFIKNL
ncbi:arylacetamide deacetylase-like 4 [Vombatus ursinus]|uniref:Alpha/beta hydrolase fold-3 domain-containing protein n=1 Tax=Vombatus ursinus TaxID=29139 RepID=A0A4X2M4X2_VOMUR|nr:arylacetamide deacetylase-like 4 [Vombatus ursinus]